MNKNIVLVTVVIGIIASILLIQSRKNVVQNPANVNLSSQLAPEITNPSGYINTDKITIHNLIGKKVILVDFWTYSCINCQRTLPYLIAWDKKYKDNGLQIIGMETPEFEFEKDKNNVEKAVNQFGITYPIVQDNNYGTWNAYGNQYWPHDYLIDITGKVVYDHIGEGGYTETENEIQTLLQERAKVLNLNSNVDKNMSTPIAVTPSLNAALSPETYFGSAKNQYFGNGKIGQNGIQSLVLPQGTDLSTFYLGGTWNFTDQYAVTEDNNEKILYRFQAKNVYFVAGASNPAVIKILIDGRQTQETTISDNSLYQVYSGQNFGEHVIEIDISGPGLKAYTFTFG